MTPISLATALGNGMTPMPGYSMMRAVAAAERRMFMQPKLEHVQLEYGILLYFAGCFDKAWLQLGAIAEQQSSEGENEEHNQLKVLLQKCQLMLELGHW